MPVDFGTGTSFGIFNFIASTVAVSFLALAFAVLILCFLLLQMCWWGVNYLPSARGVSVHTY